ncbi:ketoacyl-ACP synthase III [Vibrio mediterranei]|nr:ketoacyl-ACP synthase III [Vibrio mediterranei]
MIYIKDIGTYIPKFAVDNNLNAQKFELDDSFIESKIGAKKLARKASEESTSDMGVAAVKNLVEKSELSLDDIEVVVVVTQNGDYNGLPHTSAEIQRKLNLHDNVSCFDVGLGCSGYVYGLSILKAHMVDMGFSNGLLVTADPYSKILDENDRNTSMLFGDAATATWLSTDGVLEIGRPKLNTQGEESHSLIQNNHLEMNGRSVFNFAATTVPKHVKQYIESRDLTSDDIDLYVFHQGSKAIIDTINRRLKLSSDKSPCEIESVGNTVSSSIPLVLSGRLQNKEYQRILISGFGVGLSWATNILTRRQD